MKYLKRLVYAAMLCALSIVLTRVLSIGGPSPWIRVSLGNVPLLLAGIWLGPLWGAGVGFAADFLGAVMTTGWSPFIAPAPIILGALAGILYNKKLRVWNLFLLILVALLICEVGLKPFLLHFLFDTTWTIILTTRLPFSGLQAIAELGVTIALALKLTPFIKSRIL